MNLLPYAILFISILSLTSMGLFKGYQVTKLSAYFLHSYMVAERDARNSMETYTFAHSKTKPPKEAPSPKKETPPRTLPDPSKPFVSFRNKRITENSKLNIAPLFFREEPMLKETLTELLKEAYSHAPFMQILSYDIDSLCKNLVETLISMNKGIPLAEISLHKMHFSDETLAHVWYKMLRGTNPYHLEKKEGWPPLTTLLIIHLDKQRKPLCFNKASIPLLIAHFGQEAAAEILEKEHDNYLKGKKNTHLPPAELEKILTKHNLTNHKKLLQMSSIKNSPPITQGSDPSSGIIVELSTLKP